MIELLPLLVPAVGAAFPLARHLLARKAARNMDREYQQMIRETVRVAAEHGHLIVIVHAARLKPPQ